MVLKNTVHERTRMQNASDVSQVRAVATILFLVSFFVGAHTDVNNEKLVAALLFFLSAFLMCLTF
jgi:hypothetical protein